MQCRLKRSRSKHICHLGPDISLCSVHDNLACSACLPKRLLYILRQVWDFNELHVDYHQVWWMCRLAVQCLSVLFSFFWFRVLAGLLVNWGWLLLPIFSARCNIYISRLCYDVSVRLSVTEVHWRIIANLGFKLWSDFTAHCGRHASQC